MPSTEAHKEANKRYYRKLMQSPEKRQQLSARASKWRHEHRAHVNNYVRNYLAEHPDKRKKQNESTAKSIRRSAGRINILKMRPCADCGQRFDPVCMDFDHRDPTKKLFTISTSKYKAWKAVEAEIAKCDVVCSNCHRLRTKKARAAGIFPKPPKRPRLARNESTTTDLASKGKEDECPHAIEEITAATTPTTTPEAPAEST